MSTFTVFCPFYKPITDFIETFTEWTKACHFRQKRALGRFRDNISLIAPHISPMLFSHYHQPLKTYTNNLTLDESEISLIQPAA